MAPGRRAAGRGAGGHAPAGSAKGRRASSAPAPAGSAKGKPAPAPAGSAKGKPAPAPAGSAKGKPAPAPAGSAKGKPAPGSPAAFDHTAVRMPAQPGVYLMKDSDGTIIYIGKAKNLRNRVRSYFGRNQGYKTARLVSRIADIEFVVTDSESEAFLLESNLIKRYRPQYNIELKDQQRYTYLRVTDEKYPRLLVARRTRDGRFLGGGRVYGPFTHGSSKLLTVGTLRKSFQIRICKTLPKKECLEYHIGNCEAPCVFAAAQERYASHVADLEAVLKGGKDKDRYLEGLREEMARAAESLEFERAGELRDTLVRLDSLGDEQKMDRPGGAPDEDYIGIRMEDAGARTPGAGGKGGGRRGRGKSGTPPAEPVAHVMTLRQSNGVIRDRDRFSFDAIADNTFSAFLYQYYSTRSVPERISVNVMPDGADALTSALSRRAGRPVRIGVPSRGRSRDMIDLVMRNIDMARAAGAEPALAELASALGLRAPPRAIECFDISNHGADYAVGSMSRLVDGLPDKDGYRKFRIKTVRGRDDYAMIAEVVRRRYRRLLDDGAALPDLIVIDGGRGQLAAAHASLHALSAAVPCVSIAKREEEIFGPGADAGPLALPADGGALRIVRLARDEAHRFGVAYNRSLRRIGRGGRRKADGG